MHLDVHKKRSVVKSKFNEVTFQFHVSIRLFCQSVYIAEKLKKPNTVFKIP